MIIGICGPYCSGKDEAVSVLLNQGMVHINVDAIGHQVLEKEQENIIRVFGEGVRGSNGIDRRKLASIVFSNKKELKRLENLVHPGMKAIVQQGVKENSRKNVLINAALLYPMGLHTLCQKVLVIHCPLIQRISHAKRRDNVSLIRFFQILWRQKDIISKSFLENSDTYIVENNSSRKGLQEEILAWWEKQTSKGN